MADRNLKVQLGVRVRASAKAVAVVAAAAAGETVNEWVEQAILKHAHDTARDQPPAPLPGQTSLEVVDSPVPPDAVIKVAKPSFSTDCSMKEYHWKHGPGNPCRRCGGET